MNREMRSALVVCTRRIGDVLLATPVVRSLKTALPHLMIDMLVFEGTEDIVSANEDIRRIWVRDIKPESAGKVSEPFEAVLLAMATPNQLLPVSWQVAQAMPVTGVWFIGVPLKLVKLLTA